MVSARAPRPRDRPRVAPLGFAPPPLLAGRAALFSRVAGGTNRDATFRRERQDPAALPPASALAPRLDEEMGDLGGGLAIREKAINLVKDAVEKDKAADYPSAFRLYMSALDHFTIYLKYEKNPMMHQTIKAKFTEYLERAEELKKLIDETSATSRANPAASPDSALRAKPKGGAKGSNNEADEERSKMQGRAGFRHRHGEAQRSVGGRRGSGLREGRAEGGCDFTREVPPVLHR